MTSTREHEQHCSRPDNADRPENCLDEDDELEGIREDLYKGMQGSWEEVVNMYKQNPRVSKVKFDNIIGNTALHLAVLGGKIDVVRNLVGAINETSQDPAEVLSTPNKHGNTPLHIAAYIGSIEMCECIIGEKHIYKHLLGIPNSTSTGSFTPLHIAAISGKKEAFFRLYEMCDSTHQAQEYCIANGGKTVLHTAIQLGHWDLAFQIIHKHESLMDAVDDSGYSPLHVLAEEPTSFRSGIYLSFLDNIIYHCITVEELIPDSCKEKRKLGSVRHPNFFQKPRLLIKFSETGGDSTQKSTGQLDGENLEGGQGHHPSNGAKGHQGFPSRYSRYLSFIKLVASQMLLLFFSIILGPSKTMKLKARKEKHIWSIQIMNKLVDRAKEHETRNHPYRTSSSCRSAYKYFRRGRAEITPMILAAKNGVLEMVVKILKAFPMTILDADGQENSVALVAVGNQQFHIYDFLLGYNHVVERDFVTNVVDSNSNTLLHLAAKADEYESWLNPNSIMQLQWKVKWYEYVKNSLPSGSFRYIPNDSGQYPDQIFKEAHKELLEKSKQWLKSTGDSCSFVAALIATVAFATSATVPGGVNQDTGRPLFQSHFAFRLFSISSLVALCSSFTSLLIFVALLISKYQFRDFRRNLPLSLFLGLTGLFVSMVSMLVCFCSGHFLMLDHTLKNVAIPIYALTLIAVTYFSLKRLPSSYVLFKTVFQRVPGRIYREDPF